MRIEHAGVVVADTTRAVRVLETAGAPVWYLPPEDVRVDLLRPSHGSGTWCEWKGKATYHDLVVDGHVARRAAWSYERPSRGFERIAGYLAFYAGRVDRATVDGEAALAQPGGFYGGWVTTDVVGPFKGEPGSEAW